MSMSSPQAPPVPPVPTLQLICTSRSPQGKSVTNIRIQAHKTTDTRHVFQVAYFTSYNDAIHHHRKQRKKSTTSTSSAVEPFWQGTYASTNIQGIVALLEGGFHPDYKLDLQCTTTAGDPIALWVVPQQHLHLLHLQSHDNNNNAATAASTNNTKQEQEQRHYRTEIITGALKALLVE